VDCATLKALRRCWHDTFRLIWHHRDICVLVSVAERRRNRCLRPHRLSSHARCFICSLGDCHLCLRIDNFWPRLHRRRNLLADDAKVLLDKLVLPVLPQVLDRGRRQIEQWPRFQVSHVLPLWSVSLWTQLLFGVLICRVLE